MKKQFLIRVNIILGALSLLLAGCHSSKKAAQSTPPRPMLKYGVPTEVVAMYGVTLEADTLKADTTAVPQDTVAEPQQRPRDREILVKYGVPGMYR